MIIMLQLMQALVDLRNMLVRQCFVGLDIVGPPAEMAGGTQGLPGTGGTGDACGIYFAQQSCFGQRQQSQLDGCCKTTWVGNVFCSRDLGLVDFR